MISIPNLNTHIKHTYLGIYDNFSSLNYYVISKYVFPVKMLKIQDIQCKQGYFVSEFWVHRDFFKCQEVFALTLKSRDTHYLVYINCWSN